MINTKDFMHAYNEKKEDLFKLYQSSENGLTSNQVQEKQKQGYNDLVTAKKTSAWVIFFRQFKSLILYILIATAILSAYYKDIAGAIVIGVIIFFLTILGFIMEFKATKDMQALQKLSPQLAKVKRNGEILTIPSRELVPGDIVLLDEGDIIPADIRLITSSELKVNESTLTGESTTVLKNSLKLEGEKELSDQLNMVFATTHVSSGNAIGIVIKTGKDTQIGKIGELLHSVKKRDSPLTKRLDKLGTQLSIAVILLSVLLLLIELYRGEPLSSVLVLVVALAVSGIPESLPIVTTIALANGMKRMAKQNVIVTRIPAVETLGTCTVICTDKTGTLTQNLMKVVKIFTHKEVEATDSGYIRDIAHLCNNATISTGDPTEIALKEIGYSKKVRIKELPFDSERKMMSILTKDGFVFTKGSPEHVLDKCTSILVNKKVQKLTLREREKVEAQLKEYASKGLRVLGFAYKKSKSLSESSLTFCGLVALQDPPKEGVKESIVACKEAGITIIMITGDNPLTACAIGKDLGIYSNGDVILTGKQLDLLSDEELCAQVSSVRIIARATPFHKIRVIEALQNKGEIVAMTGDGVNDAPALKRADIGVAMGNRGTQVAKEASELILTDDNFSSIVTAIKEGRCIFQNIRKFVFYLLSMSFSQVFFVFIAILFEYSLPLTALMILFTNLLTSDISAIALTYLKQSEGVMKTPPRNPQEGLLTKSIWLNTFLSIILLVALSFGLFTQIIQRDLVFIQTFSFAFITVVSLLHSYNAQSFSHSLFKYNTKHLHIANITAFLLLLAVLYIPTFSLWMGTVPLAFNDWLLIAGVAPFVIILPECVKFIIRYKLKHQKAHFVKRSE